MEKDVIRELCRKFVPHHEGGEVVLVRTPGRLSVTHGEHGELYDTAGSRVLTYWFNVVLLMALNNREYDTLIDGALASPLPIEQVNTVVRMMPPTDSTTIILQEEGIVFAPAPALYE